MEIGLTEDDLHVYHELASEPANYEDEEFTRKSVGPNPESLAVTLLYVVFQYLLTVYILRQRGTSLNIAAFTFLYGVTVGFIFLLNKSNPGVVKKSADLESYLSDAAPATAVVVQNHRFIQRWCADCKVYRHPRVKHCYECGHCISRFDHHCQWLSNCIGHNNYKLFLIFGFYYLVTLWYSFAFTVKCITELGFFKGIYYRFDFWVSFAQYERAVFSIFLFFGINVLFATYAMMVQAYLIAIDSTYYEYVANPYEGREPFNRGIMQNLWNFCKLPLSLPC